MAVKRHVKGTTGCAVGAVVPLAGYPDMQWNFLLSPLNDSGPLGFSELFVLAVRLNMRALRISQDHRNR